MNEGYTESIAAQRFLRPVLPAPGPGRPAVRVFTVLALSAVAWLASTGTGAAQWLPATPVTWLGGRLVVSGDASVSMSTSDHRTYFNYGDYQYNMMRLARLGLGVTLRLGTRVSAATDVRAEGAVDGGSWRVYPTTLFLQVRPIAGASFAVAGGIVLPAFGAFLQRRYGADNLLIGYPLAYQDTTAVRADALPATADEVMRNRARGWSPHYSIGEQYAASGLPTVSTTGWSPGVAVSGGTGRLTGRLAVTRGGMAAPGSEEGRWEVSGRAELRPVTGLVVGLSAARGAFIAEELSAVIETATANRDPRETAFGADVEYSWGYWLVRAEAIVSSRTFPAFSAPYLRDPLATLAVESEIRYKIRPGLYAAARVGHLAFSSIQGTAATASWDAGVSRLETGLGYSLTRNLLVKAVYQYNSRDSVRRPSLHLGAVQLLVKF